MAAHGGRTARSPAASSHQGPQARQVRERHFALQNLHDAERASLAIARLTGASVTKTPCAGHREVRKRWEKIRANMTRMDQIIADAKEARRKLIEGGKKSISDQMDMVFLTPAELRRKVSPAAVPPTHSIPLSSNLAPRVCDGCLYRRARHWSVQRSGRRNRRHLRARRLVKDDLAPRVQCELSGCQYTKDGGRREDPDLVAEQTVVSGDRRTCKATGVMTAIAGQPTHPPSGECSPSFSNQPVTVTPTTPANVPAVLEMPISTPACRGAMSM
eukprot:scaffold336_cov384-Prasinococcus_capsulatus_cf.AAC.18